MKIGQYIWEDNGWKAIGTEEDKGEKERLMLIFGSREQLSDPKNFSITNDQFPDSTVVMCSTAGHLLGNELRAAPMVATTISLDRSNIVAREFNADMNSSHKTGAEIGRHFKELGPDLKLVYLFSDGNMVNGSDLMEGLNPELPSNVLVAGGLAGDDERFDKTLVGLNSAPQPGRVVAVGFLGEHLEVSAGVSSGWDPFGPLRTVTASDDNNLMELDGQSALDLYKKYLGQRAMELPGSALLFPLEITVPGSKNTVVRTILGINDEINIMTFAGNVPVGSSARFMCANFDKLIGSAAVAAEQAYQQAPSNTDELALVVSCVGRRLVLGQRVEEELEEVTEHLSPRAKVIGFYSYGEIAPGGENERSVLHNQTIAVTTIREKAA